ncbi:MAG TPA: Flp family type IVb pilin [Dermatophilaceae bacterium]|jgi:pilus assembly protein Flp/PilA
MSLFKARIHGRHGFYARGERGATAVEYGLMASLIALVIIVAVIAFGKSVNGLFELVISTAPFK